jgi:type VII secretion integral membrane protein EccD
VSTGLSAPRLAAAVGIEQCRLTVRTAQRDIDLTVPSSATLGELVDLILRGLALEGPQRKCVLQRLGGPPLDPGETPESLGLLHGDVLYLNPAESPVPEAVFDDVSVGVARVVAERGDFWRPVYSRLLLLGAACAVLAGFALGAAGTRPQSLVPVWFAASAGALTLAAALAPRLLRDPVLGTVCGVAGCAFGVLTALDLDRQGHPFPAADRRTLILVAAGVLIPAVVSALVGRLPLTFFGAILGQALLALVGGALAEELHLDAARAAAVLAVVLIGATSSAMRSVLRVARLQVPLLPHTAEELQSELEPEPGKAVTRRTTLAVSLANALYISCGAAYLSAAGLLAFHRGWFAWTLALLMSLAVLLRSRTVLLGWQRLPLAVAGTVGLCLAADSRLAGAGPSAHGAVLVGMILAAAALLAGSRLLPGRRLRPVWGQLGDIAELWTAVALLPLLFQVLNVYSYFRGLVH